MKILKKIELSIFYRLNKIIIFICFLLFQNITNAQKLIINQEINLFDFNTYLFYTSSELANNNPYNIGKYGGQNLFDKDKQTCWAEGVKGDGVGEYIFMVISKNTKAISFINGYAKSTEIYYKNNRVKDVEISLFAGYNEEGHVTELYSFYNIFPITKPVVYSLNDDINSQKIQTLWNWDDIIEKEKKIFENHYKSKKNVIKNYFVKIVILSVYHGSKYDDTCISEINTLIKSNLLLSYKSIDVNDDENIVFGINNDTKDILLSDTNSIFQILDNTPDNNWIILSVLPANVSYGRVETQTVLFNVPHKKIINFNDFMPLVQDIYNFEIIENEVYINVLKKNALDIERVSVKEIENKYLIENKQ